MVRLQKKMDGIFNYPGRYFFEIWRLNSLISTLGYPTTQSYTTDAATGVIEYPFQNGVMQIQQSPKLCYRIFNSNEIPVRAGSFCQPLPKCPKKRSPGRQECGPESEPGSCGPVTPGGHKDPADVSYILPSVLCSARANH